MKKVDFDLSAVLENFDREVYEKALEDLKKYEDILKSHIGVITGYWVGWKHGKPYILVTIEKGKCKEPEKLIPDKLGQYDVYYIEGTIRLAMSK